MTQTQYTVYLADDDEDDLEMLATALRNNGGIAEVQCYTTTQDILRQLALLPTTALPDLIVTDYHMPPSVEGELIHYIRREQRMDVVALIVYTTLLQEFKKMTLLEDGVDGVLTKGNTAQEIADHVSVFCGIVANKKLVAY
ncbi:MAG TPA: response regulator [Flavisolibacter sp.]|jgi:CheY-like chemotaxis protein|nr:response regulator [Flavisolibacter sp.]